MKEPFDAMTKVPLEMYFLDFLVPKLRNGNLKDSKKIDKYHSLREYLGLVLLSYFLSQLNGKKYIPAINNKDYDDGVICELEKKIYYPVEQTYIYEAKWDNKVLEGINESLKSKSKKGDSYAENTVLLIYCNADGELKPNLIKELLEVIKFPSVLFFGPEGSEEFSYQVYLAKDNGKVKNETYKLIIDPKGNAKLE